MSIHSNFMFLSVLSVWVKAFIFIHTGIHSYNITLSDTFVSKWVRLNRFSTLLPRTEDALWCPPHVSDYSGNPSGARRARKRSSGDSPVDSQTVRSSGRQINVRVKRTNNPSPGQVSSHYLDFTFLHTSKVLYVSDISVFTFYRKKSTSTNQKSQNHRL